MENNDGDNGQPADSAETRMNDRAHWRTTNKDDDRNTNEGHARGSEALDGLNDNSEARRRSMIGTLVKDLNDEDKQPTRLRRQRRSGRYHKRPLNFRAHKDKRDDKRRGS